MRIFFLHLFNPGFAGGSGTFLTKISRELTALGHEIEVFCAGAYRGAVHRAHRLPFEFTLTFGPERRPGEVAFDDLSLAELEQLTTTAFIQLEQVMAEGRRPDLILVNHISLLANVALRARQRWNIPYLILSYGTDTELIGRQARYRDLFAPAVTRAEAVIAISEYVARQIHAHFAARHVAVLRGAVDTGIFFPPAQHLARTRSVVFVGRLVTEKGIWTLLEALERPHLAEEVHIVGEGPLYEPLRAHIAGADLDAAVRLWGLLPQPAIRDLLVRAGLLVAPSLWPEPLGLVVLEAIACGTPVVASAVGGIPEMVHHGFNGFLHPPGDAGQLCDLINRVLGDEQLAARLSDHCISQTPVLSYREAAASLLEAVPRQAAGPDACLDG